MPAVAKRRTAQKSSIRKVFEGSANPVTPQEVWETARHDVPSLGIATVYRAVKVLLDEGDLCRVEVPGQPPRYELANKGHHHHFVCSECRGVFDVQGCFGDLKSMLPRGFTLESHDITLFGVCNECNRASGSRRRAR